MNLFIRLVDKIFCKTLTYKTYDCISSFFRYVKDYLYISDTLYSDEFKLVLKRYLNLNIKKDWLGRLYGVLNPNLDINGKFDINNMIIEIDGDNTNNNEYIKHWTYKQLNLIGSLFKIEKLYDYISLSFEHVGPSNHDNYLLVFDISSRKYLSYSFKRFLKHLTVYSIIGVIIFMLLFYI